MEVIDYSLVEPIEIRLIKFSKYQVRYQTPSNSQEVESLKSSIKEHGLLQPILIRPVETGFEVVAGHRRFSACKSLRWKTIPSKIKELSDKQTFEIQLVENIQRKSMDPIEEAEAFQRYVTEFGWGGATDLGQKIGKSEEYVSHRMQLLKLPPPIKTKVIERNLSVSHALELIGVDPSEKDCLVEQIINNKLTVKQVRDIKKNGKNSDLELDVSVRTIKPRSLILLRKNNLSLKITLQRIADFVEDAHSLNSKERPELVEFLMGQRMKIHTMIDDNIKLAKKLSK